MLNQLKGLHSILPETINNVSTNGGKILKKTLLIDIDHTLIEEKTVRPFLKEFLIKMDE